MGVAAKHGDALANEAYRVAGSYLGIGVANLLNVLNPSMIVIGGGVLKSAPPNYWKAMMKSAKENAWPEAMRAVKIVRSKLKGNVGDLGALALAFEDVK